MSKAQSLSHIFLVLSVSAYVSFMWFGHLADAAMDKSGLGDLNQWGRVRLILNKTCK
jgi:hypothetical protein